MNANNSKNARIEKHIKKDDSTKDSTSNSTVTTVKAPEAAKKDSTVTTTATSIAKSPKKRINSGKVLMFDVAHKEIFNPDDEKQLGCSQMRDVFTGRGYTVDANEEPFSDDVLRKVKAVVIAGPMVNLDAQEQEAMKRYIENGGNLLVTVHVSYFISDLSNSLGLQLSKSVLDQKSESFEGSGKNFIARGIGKHPILKGVSGVAVRAAWAIKPLQGNNSNASTIVSTSSDAWVDLNPNDIYDVGEPMGAYGIVGVAEFGKGKVIVIGDDAVFTNITINMASNRKLCDNIARWFDR